MKCIIFLTIVVFNSTFLMAMCGTVKRFSERSKEILRVLIAFVSVTAAVFGCLFIGITTAFDGMCADEIWRTIPSPSGEYVAYVYTCDCGAVTSTRELEPTVILRPGSAPPSFESGRIVSRRNWWGGEINDCVYDGDFSEIKWLSNQQLSIRSRGRCSVFIADHWQDVKILFVLS